MVSTISLYGLLLNLCLQGGFLLYVHITDVDLAINDPVENIFVNMLLPTSPSFSAPVRYTGSNGNALLEMSFRVQCSPGFTGADCASSKSMRIFAA